MAKVLVAGATGLLGSTLAPALIEAGHDVVRCGHHSSADARCDLTDREQTISLVRSVRPDVIVNLVALTDVDRCEADPDAAYRGNVLPVTNLCAGIVGEPLGAHLVHISTDMVYDGQGPHPEDRVVIRNTYALSKLAGELAAAKAHHTILRTNFLGRSRLPGRNSLSDWLFNALTRHIDIKVFEDVFFSPLSMKTLCSVLTSVVSERPAGLFNLGSGEGFSKAQLAFAFADNLGLNTGAVTRSTVEAMTSLKARRPKDMRMDCRRIEEALRVTLPTLAEEVRLIAKEYQ